MGKSIYPEIDQIVAKLKEVVSQVITIDAVELAEKAGNRQTTNVIMLGAAFGCGKMPISLEIVKDVILERVPPKAAEANMKAFELGRQACEKK